MTQKKICSTRKQAYDVLNLIMREGAYSNLALKEALKNTEHNHAARITALVYCTVEHCSYADYLIAHYARDAFTEACGSCFRWALPKCFL